MNEGHKVKQIIAEIFCQILARVRSDTLIN